MADPNFRISTPRLYLHYFQPSLDSHCDFLVTLFNAPEVLKASGDVATPVSNRESERKDIEDRVERQSQTGYGRYMVSLRPSTSEGVDDRSILQRVEEYQNIGIVSMKLRRHTEASHIPDIGFSLLRPFWGKGYATEAAQALLDYFENVKQLKEVLGFCNPENKASKKVFRRLGFEERGVRFLKGLGDRMDNEGEYGLVWVRKGMSDDLEVYGL